MRLRIQLILVLCILSKSAFNQNINFALFIDEKKIGDLKAQKTTKEGKEIYYLKSHANVNAITQVTIDIVTQCTFNENKILEKCVFKNDVNLDLYNYSEATLLHGKYIGKRNKKEVLIEETQIRYCTSNLYHTEPKDISRVFSENYLKYLEIKSESPGSYTLFLPDGQKNIYEYKNGICVKATFHQRFYTIVLLNVDYLNVKPSSKVTSENK